MNVGYVLFALATLAFGFAIVVVLAAVGFVLLRGRRKPVVRVAGVASVLPIPVRSSASPGLTLEDLVADFDARRANEAAAEETRGKLAARVAKLLGDPEPPPKL